MVYTPSQQEVGKEAPNAHQCKISSVYVPVFSSIVPGEDEDAFCSTQNTHLKWLSICQRVFLYLGRGGRLCKIRREGVRAIETFFSCWSQKQPDLNLQVWIQFSSTDTQGWIQLLKHRHRIICLRVSATPMGPGRLTQTYTRPGPSETGTIDQAKHTWTYQMALALLHGLLNWSVRLGWAE